MQQYQVEPDQQIELSALPTRGGDAAAADRKETEEKFSELRRELREWQYRWYAEGKRKLLVVFQALDAGGKDGAIRNIFRGVNPQGVTVHSFKVPSKEELAHDFLWRIHDHVPAKGMWTVFNRSHYEDVLVVRVDQIVPEHVWQRRFDHINNFEKLLSDSGTTILKFYLHISKDEQRERFQSRVDRPDKRWKFSMGDLKKRAQWQQYQAAYEDVFARTSTEYAPWYIIPADQKWYRNYAIAQRLVDTIRSLDPQYPQPEEQLAGLVIE